MEFPDTRTPCPVPKSQDTHRPLRKILPKLNSSADVEAEYVSGNPEPEKSIPPAPCLNTLYYIAPTVPTVLLLNIPQLEPTLSPASTEETSLLPVSLVKLQRDNHIATESPVIVSLLDRHKVEPTPSSPTPPEPKDSSPLSVPVPLVCSEPLGIASDCTHPKLEPQEPEEVKDKETCKFDSTAPVKPCSVLVQKLEDFLPQCDFTKSINCKQARWQKRQQENLLKNRFKCDRCDKAFATGCTLREHQMRHTGEMRYNCPICGKGFVRSSHLKRHSAEVHTGEKPFACKVNGCNQKFRLKVTLKTHQKIVHEGKKKKIRPLVQCEICRNHFQGNYLLTLHQLVHSDQLKYSCTLCDSKFVREDFLEDHMKRKVHTGQRPYRPKPVIIHKGRLKRPFKCPSPTLDTHKGQHTLSIDQSEQSDQTMERPGALGPSGSEVVLVNVGKLEPSPEPEEISPLPVPLVCSDSEPLCIGSDWTHPKIKPQESETLEFNYTVLIKPCSILVQKLEHLLAQADFTKSVNYRQLYKAQWIKEKRHRENLIQNKFKCLQCDKAYSTAFRLRKHQMRHTAEIKYNCPCPICGKAFVRPSQLIRHLRTHDDDTRETPFKCHEPSCPKTFTDKVDRDVHYRRHIGIRNYKSHDCGKTFFTRSALKVHFNTHPECTGTKFAHTCELCGRGFEFLSRLHQHQRRDKIHKPFPTNQNPMKRKGHKGQKQKSPQRKIATHADPEEPLKRPTCGRRYNLRTHEEQLHSQIQTEPQVPVPAPQAKEKQQKPFTCSVCDKSFKFNYHLCRHTKTHKLSIDHCQQKDQTTESHVAQAPDNPEAVLLDLVKFEPSPSSPTTPEPEESSPLPFPLVCNDPLCIASDCTHPKLEPEEPVRPGDLSTLLKPCSVPIKKLEDLLPQFDFTKSVSCVRLYKARWARANSINNRYKCAHCGKAFGMPYKFREHQMSHTGEKKCTCSICGKGFVRYAHLRRHSLIHTRENPIKSKEPRPLVQCEICRKYFQGRYLLTLHQLDHSDQLKYSCTLCDAKYIREDYLKDHMKKNIHKGQRSYRPKPVIIPKGQLPDVPEEHEEQIQAPAPQPQPKENPENPLPWTCSVCGKEYKSRHSLCRHKKSHRAAVPQHYLSPYVSFVCGLGGCEKKFKQIPLLRYHQKVVHGGRNQSVQCGICGKEFRRKCRLMTHYQLAHSEELKVSCTLCHANFVHEDYLKEHMKQSVHKAHMQNPLQRHKTTESPQAPLPTGPDVDEFDLTPSSPFPEPDESQLTHTQKNKYTCSVCGKELVSPQSLKNHLRIHTGEKPYKCREPSCPQTFVSNSSMNKHYLIHGGERKHKCTVCGKTFVRSDHLKTHSRSHTGENKCKVCNKSFISSTALKAHSQTHPEAIGPEVVLADVDKFEPTPSSPIPQEPEEASPLTLPRPGLCTDPLCIDPDCTHPKLEPVPEEPETSEFNYTALMKPCSIRDDKLEDLLPQTNFTTSVNWKSLLNARINKRTRELRVLNKNKFKCDRCDMAYTYPYKLRLHQMRHAGENKYTCSICGKGFVTSTSFKGHARTHTG